MRMEDIESKKVWCSLIRGCMLFCLSMFMLVCTMYTVQCARLFNMNWIWSHLITHTKCMVKEIGLRRYDTTQDVVIKTVGWVS